MFKSSRRYIRSWGALYGEGEPPRPRKRASRSNIPTEEAEQIMLVNWLNDYGIRHYSIPNGRNNVGEGLRYMRTGSVAGIPDLCVPYSVGEYHSLYLELKRSKGGVLSPQQKDWLLWLSEHGFRAECCAGFLAAKVVVMDYFGMVEDA